MTSSEATAEVFRTAFSALPPEAREGFMEKMLADPELREELEDLLDLEIVAERSGEPTHSTMYSESWTNSGHCLIRPAARARRHDLTVVFGDTHFDRVEGLETAV